MRHIRRASFALAGLLALTGAVLAAGHKPDTIYSIGRPPPSTGEPVAADRPTVDPLAEAADAPVEPLGRVAQSRRARPGKSSPRPIPVAPRRSAPEEPGPGSDEPASPGTPVPPPAPTATKPAPPPPPDDAARVLELVNAERENAGCDPVRADARLATAAQEHSSDMAAQDYLAQDTPDGVTPAERARAEGYDADVTENIAKGPTDADEAMAAWLDIPSDQAILVDCAAKSLGVGVARAEDGTTFWTQDFGVE